MRGKTASLRQRGLIWAGTGGAAVVAFLMLMVPASAVVHAPVVLTAPYAHAVSSPSNSLYWNGAGSAKLIKSASWSATTGLGVFSGSASAKTGVSFAGVGTYNSGSAYSTIDLAIPVKVATNGLHSVGVAVSMTAAGAQTASFTGSCPAPVLVNGYGSSYCSAYAGIYASEYGYVFDMTNNTYIYQSTFFTGVNSATSFYNDTYCYSGTCYNYNSSSGAPGSVSGTTSSTIYFNGTMAKSHSYALLLYISFSVSASISGYPKGTASASLNLASSGNSWSIPSITIS